MEMNNSIGGGDPLKGCFRMADALAKNDPVGHLFLRRVRRRRTFVDVYMVRAFSAFNALLAHIAQAK